MQYVFYLFRRDCFYRRNQTIKSNIGLTVTGRLPSASASEPAAGCQCHWQCTRSSFCQPDECHGL
jgi:hypothetical protein